MFHYPRRVFMIKFDCSDHISFLGNCIDVSFLDKLFVEHATSYYTQHKMDLLG
uniref:Uncharacterized protein n=1 Tax=Arundo donax TaxID=35708 RepID=A0A0A8YHN7_ARUDO